MDNRICRFWNFTEEDSENILRINGVIAEDSWWDDEVTPYIFRNELEKVKGDITVFINSPGGDVFAANQIYTMLKEHKGKITVKIDSLAASAGSMIAMAGDTVAMSPVSQMMIHNPLCFAYGESKDLEKTIEMLNEVKESIINAYQLKTGLQRAKISKLMDSETWMNPKKAIELGFCDIMLYGDIPSDSFEFSNSAYVKNIVAKMQTAAIAGKDISRSISMYEKRLNLLNGKRMV